MRASEPTELRVKLLECFVLLNVAFLAIDIYLAHSVNAFSAPVEWAPLVFSIAGTAVLGVGLWRGGRWWRWGGYAVGWVSVVLGVAGLVFHLEGRFFEERTLKSLVYSAPFAAPLAYTGLGLLLLMNRMVASSTSEWSRWVVLMALGGFVGNFALSVCDHAQNGFFEASEWAPVAGGAIGMGFLTVAMWEAAPARFLRLCLDVMLAEAVLGVVGFGLHFMANMDAVGPTAWDRFVYGAPIFAPLLFVNMALLGGFGLIDLRAKIGSGVNTGFRRR